ncbi:hypothetical protein LH991_06365 [Schleiferilactobacillus harbinensis]|nr:hypothetical protein [Schleiferilactobacillus harbinensis]QFR63619.1 hypothetical protein LH991_06365 [Schleiferilactobacillus harbinensis]
MGKIKTGLLVIVAGLFVFLSAGSVTAATVSAPSNPEQISLTAYPHLDPGRTRCCSGQAGEN